MQPVIIHDSRNTTYRYPFGAVEAGSVVTLRCEVEGDGTEQVTLRLWQEGAGETLHAMQQEKWKRKREAEEEEKLFEKTMVSDSDSSKTEAALSDEKDALMTGVTDIDAVPAKDVTERSLQEETKTSAASDSLTGKAVQKKSRYVCQITVPQAGCLLWYYFIVKTKEKTYYYGNNTAQLGGWGQQYEQEPPSYQITVYDRDAVTPEWMKHAVVYQIFPDRFNRGNVPLSQFNGKSNALLHGNWHDLPRYIKDPAAGDILYFDFFGGTLQGIREKLDYFADMGITCLYLNPVFESRSNHHYDTGNYKKIDSFLGTEEDFINLCKEAKEHGIRIILDGVFSHTGDDSIYFNRKGNYPGTGAYQSKESPYYSWYQFKKFPEEYSCWWGDKSLPEVDETDSGYQDFVIRDKDSVLKHWLQAGISGWRLDVADELPDEFLTAFYSELKQSDPEAALIGEVWEDASNKISYSKQRAYLCGGKLDSVMNYVLRRLMLDFLLGRADAGHINTLYMQQMENYPKENLYSMLNLTGSHDVERILSVLEGKKPEDIRLQEGKDLGETALSAEKEKPGVTIGEQRLLLFWAWQMTLPGMPCIYYGDEAGLRGGKDPDNRRPYPWGRENKILQTYCREFVQLRKKFDALRTGRMIPIYAEGDVYIYARSIEGGKDVFGKPAEDGLFFVMLNRGTKIRTVSIYTGELAFGELQSVGPVPAEPVSVVNGIFTVTLPSLSQQIYKCEEKNKPPKKMNRKAGILLHPTSLWGNTGREKKEAAREWIDFLAAAGQKIWQILPLNPPGLGNSPYLSVSAFAGHETLFAEAESNSENEKESLVKKTKNADRKDQINYLAFCKENSYWLSDYAMYRALQDHFRTAWQEWPADIRQRKPKALKQYRKMLAEQIEAYQKKQYDFFCVWQEIKACANAKGISVLGDMPIFVAADSAECWAHPEYFYLDEEGYPDEVAGVPPDYFSATGQIWGNPLYRWDVMEKDDFRWWKERFRAVSRLTDMIRVDHFRGFDAAWGVPRGEKDATTGSWKPAKGREMFLALRKEMPGLQLVAEDLGQISEEVYRLKKELGLPGMRILQFHLQNRADGLCDFATEPNCVAYTGTHDNNTLKGWLDEEVSPELRNQLRSLINKEPDTWSLIEYLYSRRAETVIVPAQDMLGLSSACRMNTPGTPSGNWMWKMEKGCLTEELSNRLASLAKKYKR
jgi:4-alpha-glucanotransferase